MSRSALRVGLAAMMLATAAVTCMSSPVSAQLGPDAPPVIEQGADIIGGIEAQVNTLNSGSPGGGGPPPSCTWTQTVPGGEPIGWGGPKRRKHTGPNGKFGPDGVTHRDKRMLAFGQGPVKIWTTGGGDEIDYPLVVVIANGDADQIAD